MAKVKLNYKELLAELNDEVAEGVLAPSDSIQVLRDKNPIFQDYCAIIDWYYDEFAMKEELGTPLEEMYLEEEFSKEEWKDMKEEREVYKKQYEADKPDLVAMTVKDVLTEMKQMQKLFS